MIKENKKRVIQTGEIEAATAGVRKPEIDAAAHAIREEMAKEKDGKTQEKGE